MGRVAAVSILLGLVLAAAACQSQRTGVEDQDAVADELPTLVGRFAEEGVASSLISDEAYIGPDDFYIRYERDDGIVYAGGRWSHRLDIEAVEQQTDGTYAGPYILPIEYQQSQRWPEVPGKLITPRILSSEQWLRFLNSLFATVLPEEEKAGVVMHFDADDYFLYLNERGDIEARLHIDKPADYAVKERIGFGDFIARGMPQLGKFVAAERVTERRIVFNTGDVGPYSLPFVYVDLDFPIAVFVRYPPAPREGGRLTGGTQKAQAGAHIAGSNTIGLAVRPVSSVFRLLFMAKDVAVETVKPTWLVTLDSLPIPPLNEGPGMDLVEWEEKLDRLTNRKATLGEIGFLIDGAEYFTRFIDAVTTATESVNIRTYIFDNDDYAERIGNLIKRRSSEGIEVKVLLDGLGTIWATGADDESMPEDYVPPASVHQFLERDSEVVVRQARNPWFAGDHVKTTIIDNKLAFTGGMNIGREYRYSWHDMMMELRGPVVDILNHEFHDAWANAGVMGDFGYFFHKLRPNRNYADDIGYPVRVLFTRPGNAEIFRAQRDAIRKAKSYIYVENAYFTDDAMLYELAKARKRGVDVRVILPMVGNHGPINKSNALAANAMMEQGIRVYVYPGMSHVKAAIIDDWACLGSANWDKLSFRVNKELNIATSHPAAVNELRQRLFEEDLRVSVELLEPIPVRWSDHLNEILADFLL
jgi:cardiolipin synthase